MSPDTWDMALHAAGRDPGLGAGQVSKGNCLTCPPGSPVVLTHPALSHSHPLCLLVLTCPTGLGSSWGSHFLVEEACGWFWACSRVCWVTGAALGPRCLEMSGVCPSTATQTLCPPEDDGQAQFCGPLLASLAATPRPKALCEDQSWAAERGLNKVSAQVSCCFCLWRTEKLANLGFVSNCVSSPFFYFQPL